MIDDAHDANDIAYACIAICADDPHCAVLASNARAAMVAADNACRLAHVPTVYDIPVINHMHDNQMG